MKYLSGVVVAAAVTLAGCSGNSSTAPTSSGPPNVAGSYSGTVTINYISLGRTLTCPAQTTVTQNGANVTLAPLALTGVCASVGSLPLGDMTISNTGSLGNTTLTNQFFASCGGSYDITASGGFFGNTLQFAFVYTAKSGGCVTQVGNFSFSGNLSK